MHRRPERWHSSGKWFEHVPKRIADFPHQLRNAVAKGGVGQQHTRVAIIFQGKTHGVDSVCTVIVVVDYILNYTSSRGFLGADECSQPNTIENSGGDRTHRGIESLCWKEGSKKGRFVWCYYYGKRRVIRIGKMTTRRDDHLDWLFVSPFLLPPTNSDRPLTFSSFKIFLSFLDITITAKIIRKETSKFCRLFGIFHPKRWRRPSPAPMRRAGYVARFFLSSIYNLIYTWAGPSACTFGQEDGLW